MICIDENKDCYKDEMTKFDEAISDITLGHDSTIQDEFELWNKVRS